MTSGPIDKITMKIIAATPAEFRSAVHPVTSRIVEKWSPFRYAANRRAEVFFLWFPKCGGTWVRMMMHRALSQHFDVQGAPPLELEYLKDFEPRIPRIRPFHDDAAHWKTPKQLRQHRNRYRGRKCLVLVRDPRDAIVSLHLQVTKRWRVDPDMPLSEFIWSERGSLKTMIEYYNVWARNKDVPSDLLIMRYEDLHADTEGSLRKLLDFVGVPDVSDETIKEAVAYNNISAMRKREEQGEYETRRLKPGIKGDKESLKSRRGKIGGFVDYISPEDCAKMTKLIEETMDPSYGYPWPVELPPVG